MLTTTSGNLHTVPLQSAPCDQLDHELISIYLIDYNHMKTFDNAGNIAPNHVSI